MVTFVIALAPSFGAAQTIFTYSATDYKTIVATEPGPITVPVNTLIIIQPTVGAPRPQVATRTFSISFRPPEVAGARILQAVVDDQIVDINILRSNIDGEMEALVEIPIASGNSPELKIDWSTKNLGPLEMTLKPEPTIATGKMHVRGNNSRPSSRPIV